MNWQLEYLWKIVEGDVQFFVVTEKQKQILFFFSANVNQHGCQRFAIYPIKVGTTVIYYHKVEHQFLKDNGLLTPKAY